jgi:type IV pilus assembly protein PilM
MDHFTRENMKVACVQISPIALYNYAMADIRNVGGYNEKATVILDMGAENTTLVVCSQTGVWQRSIRIGGNAFTEAIADAFHLSFRKAEKLKRTAPMSKYMRQIFTAMKPVFTDLASEVQRSLGFYSSSGAGREKGFARVVALGGGMKLQGLAKYLQQTLGVPVVKPDSFETLKLADGVSAAKFHENVSDFGVVYGLGAQLLGDAKIEVNLLPRKIARAIAWRRKGRMFAMAACMLLCVSILSLVKANVEKVQYNSHEGVRGETQGVIREGQQSSSELRTQIIRQKFSKEKIAKEEGRFKFRDVVPAVNQMIMACLPNKDNNPAQAQLYEAFESGDVETVMSKPRSERKQLFVTSISVRYVPKLSEGKFEDKGGRRQVRSRSRSYDRREESRYEGGYGRGEEGDYDYYGRRGDGQTAYSGGMVPGASAAEEDKEDGPGFVVVIEGYSPYAKIAELLDPHSVGSNKDKWGFVTRLVNVSKATNESRFKLFKKDDIKHFELKEGAVDPDDSDTPVGIGIEKDVERVSREVTTAYRAGAAAGYGPGVTGSMRARDIVYMEPVLVDPMTNEEMSKIFDIYTREDIDNNPDLTEKDLGRKRYDEFDKPLYIERDHWFRIKAKFRWEGAPEMPETMPVDGMGMRGMGMGGGPGGTYGR